MEAFDITLQFFIFLPELPQLPGQPLIVLQDGLFCPHGQKVFH